MRKAARQRELRVQRLQQQSVDVGLDALPPDARAQAARKIALDAKAVQVLRGQQMATQIQAKDQTDATALTNLFVIADNNNFVSDAADSGSMVVSPEQQAAIDERNGISS